MEQLLPLLQTALHQGILELDQLDGPWLFRKLHRGYIQVHTHSEGLAAGNLHCRGIADMTSSRYMTESVLHLVLHQRTLWDETLKSYEVLSTIKNAQEQVDIYIVRMQFVAIWPTSAREAIVAIKSFPLDANTVAVAACSVPSGVLDVPCRPNIVRAVLKHWVVRISSNPETNTVATVGLVNCLDPTASVPKLLLSTAASTYPTILSDLSKQLKAAAHPVTHLSSPVPEPPVPTPSGLPVLVYSVCAVLLGLLLIDASSTVLVACGVGYLWMPRNAKETLWVVVGKLLEHGLLKCTVWEDGHVKVGVLCCGIIGGLLRCFIHDWRLCAAGAVAASLIPGSSYIVEDDEC